MPWPGASLQLAVLILVATVGPPGLLAEGNVGCLFSDSLCLKGIEWCYDDFAFGKCLLANGDNEEDDLFRYNLEREALHELSHELRRLFALGYRWSHLYTQCRLQAMLLATRNDLTFDNNACSHLVDQDLEGALKALEGQTQLEPEETAIVKFTPSEGDPHADFADEVYYPPVDDPRNAIRDIVLPPDAVDIMDMADPYSEYEVVKRAWIPQMHRRSLPNAQIFSDYNTPADFRQGRESRDDTIEFLPRINQPGYDQLDEDEQDNSDRIAEVIGLLKQLNFQPEDYRDVLSRENYEKLLYLMGAFDDNEARQDVDVGEILRERLAYDNPRRSPERFSIAYNTPERFREGWESRDTNYVGSDLPEPRIYFDEDPDGHQAEEYGSGLQSPSEEIFRELSKAEEEFQDNNNIPESASVFREANLKYPFQPPSVNQLNGVGRKLEKIENKLPGSSVYTEGGVLYVPSSQLVDDKADDDDKNFGALLEKLNLGFQRPERLDVKKPGPPFDEQISGGKKEQAAPFKSNMLPSVIKKEPRGGAHPNPIREVYIDGDRSQDNYVDSDFVYIQFKNRVYTWQEGELIISNITKLLNLTPSAITKARVDPNEVTFKIDPKKLKLNASEVAKNIELIRDQLKESTGVEITAAGVGDKFKKQSVILTATEPPNQFYIVMMMISGVLLAILVAGILLLVIRRHIASREKLSGLTRHDTEASKDYQDLCRARMATKGQTSADTVHGRITSLSRESEQSPSSRSSTSSWSEEPALHNMDISTGHMVLSYMEDHLKNKDRLEQEWVALCAYVAEPCETSVALKKDNINKNRYPDVMPYDHSRVVLNELSNATGSDYINASTITDHDPRNPAYIATQGPLPHTAPDFWQLIWEQGAVVIVMLTRLTEGGAAMCHRYWPEEGSELYHIYEVHLVSEHIWCDDYLVRSFYLKNTRTGETRTVTQFHFLSWPEASVPASTKALLEFRRKVNKSYRGRSCPIVVHCSDGAGRTGTYCLIDMVLSRMAKGAKEIDIAATLEHLRDQRPRMVATKQQFEFVLTAVAEEVHAILKALPPQPTPTTQQPEKQQ